MDRHSARRSGRDLRLATIASSILLHQAEAHLISTPNRRDAYNVNFVESEHTTGKVRNGRERFETGVIEMDEIHAM